MFSRRQQNVDEKKKKLIKIYLKMWTDIISPELPLHSILLAYSLNAFDLTE